MSSSFSRISGRIAVSMALSWTLITGARAEAPTPPAAAPAKQAPMVSSGKNLNTIPEDGMGDETWLSGATRTVRELQAARPKEDMVICIAGCIPSMNRVVFSQEALPPLPKPVDTMSDAAPAAAPDTNVETPADSKATDAAPAAQKAEDDKKPEFVPSMSEPKTDAPAATDAPPTADAPPSDAPAEPK